MQPSGDDLTTASVVDIGAGSWTVLNDERLTECASIAIVRSSSAATDVDGAARAHTADDANAAPDGSGYA